jgi:pyruvate formate lyase activating enzyme
VKSFGLDVKLDTNGTNPQLLGQLLDQGLIDYVAMDVKAPLNPVRYSELAGVNLNGGMADIKKSIKLLMNSGVDYEFRTTVVPGVHTQEDIDQKFKPNTRFDELNKSHTQSDEEMELLAQTARKHVKEVEWRGK